MLSRLPFFLILVGVGGAMLKATGRRYLAIVVECTFLCMGFSTWLELIVIILSCHNITMHRWLRSFTPLIFFLLFISYPPLHSMERGPGSPHFPLVPADRLLKLVIDLVDLMYSSLSLSSNFVISVRLASCLRWSVSLDLLSPSTW